MTTTISDLPEDLLMEILCRVPLKSTRAVRFTCKKWDTLSKSGILCNEAAREEAGESRMVLIMDNSLHLISVAVADVDHPSTKLKGKLSPLSLDDSNHQQQQVKIVKVFHCDGLLVCVLKDSFKLVVWNPYLGQTRWIEPPSYSHRWGDGIDRYRYALGYDYIKKSHKILRFMDDQIYRVNDPRLRHTEHVLRYEIYDFDSSLWRTLDVGKPNWHIFFYNTGVPLNGNTYWLAQDKNSGFGYGLIGFDFTSETFGPFLPVPVPSEEDRYVKRLLSCLKGEKLSLLLQFSQPSKVEVWVTTMIDLDNVSWSKFFKVDEAEPINFASSGFFIDEEKKLAMVFDKFADTRHTLNIIGEAGLISQVDVDPLVQRGPSKTMDHAHVCSYVPSLVQVQIKKRGVDKKETTKQA